MDLESEMPAMTLLCLKIGDSAPDFSLPGIDGKNYSLADFKDAPVLMVVFLSNHCPYSHAAETRLLPMYAELKSKGLAVIAINPNSPAGLDVSELGYGKFYNDEVYPEIAKLYAGRTVVLRFPTSMTATLQQVAGPHTDVCARHTCLFSIAIGSFNTQGV